MTLGQSSNQIRGVGTDIAPDRTPLKLRSLAEFDEYNVAEALLEDLRAQLKRNQERQVELGNMRRHPSEVADERARELVKTGKMPPDARKLIDQEQQELQVEEDVLTRGIELARVDLLQLVTKLSRKVCDEVRPAHQKAACAVLEALHGLAKASKAEQRIREGLSRGGLNVCLPNLSFVAAGSLDPNDPQSTFCFFVRELWEARYLDQNDPLWKELAALHGWRG